MAVASSRLRPLSCLVCEDWRPPVLSSTSHTTPSLTQRATECRITASDHHVPNDVGVCASVRPIAAMPGSGLHHFRFVIPKGYRRGNDGRLLCYFKYQFNCQLRLSKCRDRQWSKGGSHADVCHASVLGRPLHVGVPAPRQRDIQGKQQLPSTGALRRQGRHNVYRGEGTTNGGDFQTALVVWFSPLFLRTVAVEQPLDTPSISLPILTPATGTLTVH